MKQGRVKSLNHQSHLELVRERVNTWLGSKRHRRVITEKRSGGRIQLEEA